MFPAFLVHAQPAILHLAKAHVELHLFVSNAGFIMVLGLTCISEYIAIMQIYNQITFCLPLNSDALVINQSNLEKTSNY